MIFKSDLAQSIIQSEIRNMSIECNKIGGINLSQGFSDTPLHPIISNAAIEAIQRGENHYTRYDGIPELRKALSEKLSNYNKIVADPETEIIVTNGSTAALFCVLYSLCKKGDEVLLFEPYYGYHFNTILALGLKPMYCRLDPQDWIIDFELLKSKLTEKTKVIILNTPTNPTGKVFTKEEILTIGKIAKEKNILIVTDEIYEYFLYDDAEHISPASLPEIKENVITIGGYSKTFSITGWRVGYIVCNKELAKTIGYVHDLYYVCAPAPLQAGVKEGIENLKDDFYKELKINYSKKRKIICAALTNCGIKPVVPQGSYYVMADISLVKGNTSKEKAMNFLKSTKIAIVPGEAFYHDDVGKNIARICFAKQDNILNDVVEILSKVSF